MATQVEFNKKGIEQIKNGLLKPISSIVEFFRDLGVLVDRQTQLTFRMLGRGPIRWPKLSRSTIATQSKTISTFKIRYGTDKKPKRTRSALIEYKTKNDLWFKPGPMKGYKSQRRYSSHSKPLQASGSFRKSFRVQRISRRSLIYGSNYMVNGKLVADKIQKGGRNVLFVLPEDEKEYSNLLLKFWFKRMTF